MEELRLLFGTSKLRATQACERSGAGGRLRCSNPNELVEPDEVPPRRGPDCNGSQGPRERPLPVDVAKNVQVIHSALYNHPKWIKFSFGKLLVPDTIRMVIK